jgi:hypothetical protein
VYETDLELKRNSYNPNAVSYQPPVEEDLATKKKAEDELLRNRSKAVRNEQAKSPAEGDSRYESPDYEGDHNQDESPSKATTGKTLKKAQLSSLHQESSDSQQKEDLQIDKSSGAESSPSYDDDRDESPLEASRRRQHEDFFAMCQPEIKPLRIPAEVDPEDYLEAFYYVLRNRNINILFNNIYKNATLRTSAALFLTTVFDSNDGTNNSKVNKQNEKLLDKYQPEVVMSGFIDTVLAMHEPGYDSLQNPGAFFTSRCKFYQQNKPDVETAELINRFASMSYHAFAGEMHTLINSGQMIRTKKYKKRS